MTLGITEFKLPKRMPCAVHPDKHATWEWTLYERAVPPLKLRSTHRGFVCDDCMAPARDLLKQTKNALLLLLRIR